MPGRVKNQRKSRSERVLGASCSNVGFEAASWRHLGLILAPFWRHLGAILGSKIEEVPIKSYVENCSCFWIDFSSIWERFSLPKWLPNPSKIEERSMWKHDCKSNRCFMNLLIEKQCEEKKLNIKKTFKNLWFFNVFSDVFECVGDVLGMIWGCFRIFLGWC